MNWSKARAPAGSTPKSAGFSKKTDKGNKIFWIVAGVVGLAIVCGLLYAANDGAEVGYFSFSQRATSAAA